ncbi:Crp/Fnr family transcriptional regulator [Rhizobium deserti]|uniref:Crp/Fnr family transcriptional regulator n=1 Tax=Rhizobium deserti TaxID=2547961 RepID=A0A4R5UAS5_9HYPH|nr:helix-turn-helix domain-containing protein [Rhizobium deserti]TDK32133.1 Crp/Fnr family transcriptional regulator [Rhizobium deserti]
MRAGLSGWRILLVEDDYYEASELVARLSALGVDVAGPSPNVTHALEQLDLGQGLRGAILDINLGGEMVFPLADELERRAIPFIFATGYEKDVVPPRHANKILLRKPVDEEAVAAAFAHVSKSETVTAEEAARNGIIGRLTRQDRDLLVPFVGRVHLPRGAIVELQDQPISRVYFPLGCILSSVAISREGSRTEAGLIGREGMSGFGFADGDDRSPYELISQIDGPALFMAADDLKRVMRLVPALALLARRFARSLSIQASFTALANARFEIRARLARWLLMLQDRADRMNEFRLTHEYLGIMLGVRRPSVTDALHLLEGEKMIRSTRSRIEILDRPKLIRLAGDSYGVPESEHARIMKLPLE